MNKKRDVKTMDEKKSLREHKISRKKREILDAAIEILLEKDIQQVTMEEIAANLLMTKGSLYYYFKNKDDLIYQCHEMFLSESVTGLLKLVKDKESASEKLKKAIQFHVHYLIDYQKIYNLILKPEREFPKKYLSRILKKRTEYEELFDSIIIEGLDNKEFHITDVRMARMMVLGAMNWIQQWYSEGGERTKDEIAEVYSEYLLKIFI